MNGSLRRLALLTLFASLLSTMSTLAFAQGSATATLTGTVVDTSGGTIPGATIEVKNTANGTAVTGVSNGVGVFNFPGLPAGTYTVTVSLSSFKTVVIGDVKLVATTTANVKATLEVGALSEIVTVKGGAELIQTASPTVSSTIGIAEISQLPLVTRNALNFVTFLPGVDTPGIQRDSTISGLPQGALNITLDGVNIQDQTLKTTDGFFAYIRPNMDMVEEVTVSTATQGASAAGQGAVNIAFVTRSGTNQLKGSTYYYLRHPDFNSNYYFNEINKLPKNNIKLHQYGTNVGGPVVIPGVFDGHNKMFFFGNYEEFYQPTSVTRTRTVINPLTATGVFQYVVNGQTLTKNVLQLAAQNGQISATDPTVAKTLAAIAASTQTTGVINPQTNPNLANFVYQAESKRTEHLPTVKVDYNVTSSHRVTGSYNFQKVNSAPDLLNNREAPFPGFANTQSQYSFRNSASGGMTSTLSSSMTNEFKIGGAWGPVFFGNETVPSTFDETGGYRLTLGFGLTSPNPNTNSQNRTAPNLDISDTLNYLRGSHSFQFGAAYTQVNVRLFQHDIVPNVGLGFDTTNDPAAGLFTTTNFPGASNTNLGDARALYALLTGRVTSINGNARLNEATNEYQYMGEGTTRGRLNEYGLFAQDQWRLRPNFTLNFGVRWEVQLPFYPTTSVMATSTFADLCGVSGEGSGANAGGRGCNFFQPGVQPGIQPTYVQYDAGKAGYKTDYNNFAPNIGAAWQPGVQEGFLRKLLGDPSQSTIRGGYSVSYTRQGMNDFTAIYGANPGSTVTTNRNVNNANIVYPGEQWPVLYSQAGRLGAPATCTAVQTPSCVPVSPAYPLAAVFNSGINIFDPELQLPFSRSFSVGLQRSVTRDMAVEVRYVGTRSGSQWTTEDWNEVNVYETGFLDEFKLAQANLAANVAAGRGGTFAYMGPNTGTAPLPIYLANFVGRTDATSAAAYTGTNWNAAARVNELDPWDADPQGAANNLYTNATFRTNLLAAGRPANFWVINPAVSAASIRRSVGETEYNSLQIELRKRLSNGFSLQSSYTYGLQQSNTGELDTIRRDRVMTQTTGGEAGIRHALKFFGVYDIPVGQGRRYGSNMNGWLNGALGGWELAGTGRIQSGRMLRSSGVRLVGMTLSDLQKEYRIRKDSSSGTEVVYILPQDIIDNTRRAFNSDPVQPSGWGADGAPTGRYIAPEGTPGCVAVVDGDCGMRSLIITAPKFVRVDLSVKKKFTISRRVNFDIQYDMLNVFDNINFIPVFNPGGGATIFQVTSAYTDVANTFDPGGRIGQLILRLNW